MNVFACVVNMITSWIGFYVIVASIWKLAEISQFGEDLYMVSKADSFVCFVITLVLAVLCKRVEREY